MNYIVLDLEWNQNPNQRAKPNKLLPFEIFEIGAVKLDEHRKLIDTFHGLIKPSVYHWIQDNIHDVVHVTYKELRRGRPFSDVAQDFFDWCGEDFIFCTWAKQDVGELQRNLRYYYMLDLLPGPVLYLDVQKLYSLSFEDGQCRRSLEAVVQQLHIQGRQRFHRAIGDAMYTARVLQRIDAKYLKGYESVDCYQNPKTTDPDYILRSPDRIKVLTRERGTRERVMQDAITTRIHCPICDREKLRDLEGNPSNWFYSGSRIGYCVASCPEHGTIVGRLRVRKTDQGKHFAVKTLRLTSEEEGRAYMEKRTALKGK